MRRRLGAVIGFAVLAGVMAGTAAFVVRDEVEARDVAETAVSPTTTTSAPSPTTTTMVPSTTTTTVPVRLLGAVPGFTVGEMWGTVRGLTMFRGNPTRTFYGTGPLSDAAPSVLWTYPEQAMCGSSVVGGESSVWCGTGWTGQPVVWERPDGITEVIFGAYDKAVHFLDAATGLETRAPFPVGDIIKGSVTLDPDGFPLLYMGGRDDRLRVVALDREPVEELWALEASAVRGMWNNDWDGNPVVVDDYLYEGGENSWFFVIRLNRGSDAAGLVTVDPEIAFSMPGWTDELLARVGRNVSIESSVVAFDRRVYFTNSGGRVVGVDLDLALGGAEDPVVFDYWVGDDADATPVVDAEGKLYVAVEYERGTERSREVGQLVKLDPYATGDPRVWGVEVLPAGPGDGGIWATPAVGFGHVYVPTHTGRLLAVDAGTGEVVWEDTIGFHAWSSALIVDDSLIVGTCETGELRRYSLSDPAAPELVWSFPAAGGCIESTPAVWNGTIFVGSRDGFFRAYR
jgi:outer membrane protein assembly factor BamB